MVLIAGLLIALLAIALVLEPVMRPTFRVETPPDDEDLISPEERRRDQALAALKEIDFDRATGKLSDVDYDALKAKYTGEAVAALRAEDSPAVSVPRSPGRSIPRFCEECGAPLEGSGRYCAQCGTATFASANP